MSRSNIIIRCDARPELGYGHLYRCMVLARRLKAFHHQNVIFAVRQDRAGEDYIAANGFQAVTQPDALSEAVWMGNICREHGAAALVLDIRTDLERSQLEALRGDDVLIVVIDDGSDRRLAGDLVFLPPVPQLKALSWETFTGVRCIGFEWTLIDPPATQVPWTPPGAEPRVLVTMGGSDPAGLTFKAVEALEKVPLSMCIDVVAGPGFQRYDALAQSLGHARRRFNIHRDVDDMYVLMGSADLALISFGHTAYELAAIGVPTVYLCLTEDHALSASALAKRNMGISLGVHRQVAPDQLAQCVEKLLADHALMQAISAAGRETMQGGGAGRVAEVIVAHLAVSTNPKTDAGLSGSARCERNSNIESAATTIIQGREC